MSIFLICIGCLLIAHSTYNMEKTNGRLKTEIKYYTPFACTK